MASFPLCGLDRNAWSEENESDLVALMPRMASDPFSEWFSYTLMPMFHHVIGEKFKVRTHRSPINLVLTLVP